MLLENVGNVLTMIDVMNCITEDPGSLYPHVTLSTSPFWQNCKKRDLLLRWVTLTGYDAGGEVFTLDSHATGVPKELFLEVFCPSAVPVFLFFTPCGRCGVSGRSSSFARRISSSSRCPVAISYR